MGDYLKKTFLPPIADGHQIYAHLEPAGLAKRKKAATRFAKGSGQRIELELEPSNPYDPNAIRIIGCWQGWLRSKRAQLGYVPRELAKVIADQDVFDALEPRLARVYLGRTGYVEIGLQLTGPKKGAKRFKAAVAEALG